MARQVPKGWKKSIAREMDREFYQAIARRIRQLMADEKEAKRVRDRELAAERRERRRALAIAYAAAEEMYQKALRRRRQMKRAPKLRGAAMREAIRQRAWARIARSRAARAEERAFRAELRRAEKTSRAQQLAARRLVKGKERSAESDDEVRASIPPEYTALWEQVKGRMRGTPNMSRAEQFLQYAHDHPTEVYEAMEEAMPTDEQYAREYLEHCAAMDETGLSDVPF